MMADAMEMMLLSFVGPTIRCEWHLETGVDGIITTSIFLGGAIGMPFWGYVADVLGRRYTCMAASMVTVVAGTSSVLTTNITYFSIVGSCVGFGLAGAIAVASVFVMEALPVKNRGRNIMLFWLFWSLGSFLEACLGWTILPSMGWQWLVVFSTIPIALSAILICCIPESAHALASRGLRDEAQAVLEQMAAQNGVELPPGRLRISSSSSSVRSSKGLSFLAVLKEMVYGPLGWSSIMLVPIFFCCGFTYYGAVLLTSEISADSHGNGCALMENAMSKSPFSDNDFQRVMTSAAAELPGMLTVLFLVERLERRTIMAGGFSAATVSISMLFFGLPASAETICLFIYRASTNGVFSLVILYANELYPTVFRSSAVGLFGIFMRAGGMVAPGVGQDLYQEGHKVAVFVLFTVSSALAALCAINLPFDTAGRELTEQGEEAEMDFEKKPLLSDVCNAKCDVQKPMIGTCCRK